MKNKLSMKEKNYLKSYDAGEWKRVGNLRAEKNKYKLIARTQGESQSTLEFRKQREKPVTSEKLASYAQDVILSGAKDLCFAWKT